MYLTNTKKDKLIISNQLYIINDFGYIYEIIKIEVLNQPLNI